MKVFKLDDVIYRLGENAKENHQLIDDADKNDWWFHLDNHPSGHVVVDLGILNKTQIKYAATIVKEHSKLKYYKKVKVCYLQIKNLKKTKNPGEVKLLKNPEFVSI